MAPNIPVPKARPRKTSDVVRTRPGCRPLREAYDWAVANQVTSWNQVEPQFLTAMSAFDTTLADTLAGPGDDATRKAIAADLQNGKGDWFNDLLALLLENCSGIENLYARSSVPGLIIAKHNLDGVYPGDPNQQIEFLLEAKMMGTPKHAGSPGEKEAGRDGSKDTPKRVKELAFKSIDLKGEASRRLTMLGHSPSGGAGGGDLSMWLHSNPPRIYFFMAVRVLSETDLQAIIRWSNVALQVVDAVGLYAYEPTPNTSGWTTYRRRAGVPTTLELERVLFRACQELKSLKGKQAPPTGAAPPGPAATAPGA